MGKKFVETCGETKCPDYHYCLYENMNGRLNKCEKRELEIEEEEMANEGNDINARPSCNR